MANAIFDADNKTLCENSDRFVVSCYLGFGVGYTHQIEKISYSFIKNGNRRKFHSQHKGAAWQLLAGLAHQFTDNINLSLEYRFFMAHKNLFSHMGLTAKYYF
jgi:opacity protein-like surface antigen